MIVRVLLLAVLAAAMVYFAVMAVRRRRRSRLLARSAHGRGMRFSARDPFDMPRRYGRMALLSSGHSPRARDVTHGHVAGRGVRAFDFRCEAGHATRRVTRHYSVLVAEGVEAPRVLMWHVEDLALAPLAAREGRTVAAPWRCVGEPSAAEQLAHAAGALGERPVSMEVRDGKLLLCAPTSGADREDAIGPDDLEMLLNRLDAERVSRHASDVEITPPAR